MGIFGNAFSGWHLVLILAVVFLLFGAAKLPALAKSVGQSMKIFKNEVKTAKDDDVPAATVVADQPREERRETAVPLNPDTNSKP